MCDACVYGKKKGNCKRMHVCMCVCAVLLWKLTIKAHSPASCCLINVFCFLCLLQLLLLFCCFCFFAFAFAFYQTRFCCFVSYGC